MPYEVAAGLSRGDVVFQAWLNERALLQLKIDGSPLAPDQVAYIDWLRAMADRIRSTSGRAFRTSEVIETESEPSKIPEELTVSQASKTGLGLLPWSDHEIRCKIRRGEIPILRREPVIMLSRDVLIAWMISRETERPAA
jgi:hypothetical protein